MERNKSLLEFHMSTPDWFFIDYRVRNLGHYVDIRGDVWRYVSQYKRHPDHPDDLTLGHPNNYFVCPLCNFHVLGFNNIWGHKCDPERIKEMEE